MSERVQVNLILAVLLGCAVFAMWPKPAPEKSNVIWSAEQLRPYYSFPGDSLAAYDSVLVVRERWPRIRVVIR